MTIGISSGRASVYHRRTERTHPPGAIVASGYESIRLVSLCGGAHIGTWNMPAAATSMPMKCLCVVVLLKFRGKASLT